MRIPSSETNCWQNLKSGLNQPLWQTKAAAAHTKTMHWKLRFAGEHTIIRPTNAQELERPTTVACSGTEVFTITFKASETPLLRNVVFATVTSPAQARDALTARFNTAQFETVVLTEANRGVFEIDMVCCDAVLCCAVLCCAVYLCLICGAL